ncbi:MAG: glycosyltransferase [Phycisphaerae bacterium]|nr:glycosyltransferase [Phycisphaerae bacterium]
MSSHAIELALFWIYVFIGPGSWVLFGFGMIKGRKRMDLFREPSKPLPEPPPRVSILIPAKDEAARIAGCIESALQQNYSNFEVIAVDDRSSDGTERIMDELAARDPHLIVLHIQPGDLPAGWFGKSFALHTAVPRAGGQWLFFVDSDVVLKPNAIGDTVALAEEREFDLVSLLPELESGGFWESLIVPLGGVATNAMYLLPLTNANESKVAFANGQFLCIRKSVYDAVGGHAAVGHLFSEDVQIARRVKGMGYRPRLSVGTRHLSVRMYDSPQAVFHGWARNFYAGSLGKPWRIMAAMAFLVACAFSAYAAIIFGIDRMMFPVIGSSGIGWLIAGGFHLIVMTTFIGVMYRWTGNRWTLALLLPLGLSSMFLIFCRSLYLCATGRVAWRGTVYARGAKPQAAG